MSLPYIIDGETDADSTVVNTWIGRINGLTDGTVPIALAGIEGALGAYGAVSSSSGTERQRLIIKDGDPTWVSQYVFEVTDYLNVDRTGVADSSLGIRAAIADASAAHAYTGYAGVVSFPPGTYIANGLSSPNGSVLFEGATVGSSRLVHTPGASEPLVSMLGGSSGTSAIPWGGFRDISLTGDSATTAIVYYEGAIDNNVVFDRVQIAGSPNNPSCDGISIQDWLNFHMSEIRFDGLGGWGINIRAITRFGGAEMSLRNFSYDNQNGARGGEPFGNGMLLIDCSALGADKGVVLLQSGRIEVNDTLHSSVIRVLQNPTILNAGKPQIHIHADSLQVFAADETDDMRFISTDQRDVAVNIENSAFYQIESIYNNDAKNSKNMIPGARFATQYIASATTDDSPYNWSGHDAISMQSGICQGVTSSRANMVSNVATGRGGVVHAQTAAERVFAYKNIETEVGRYRPEVVVTTGSITASSDVLTLTAATATGLVPGQLLTIAGAGTAGGLLTARINAIDRAAKEITLDRNAVTTVSGADISYKPARYAAVPLVFLGTAAPTADTYLLGDYVKNTAPAEVGSGGSKYVVAGWICVAAGTPGTWVDDRRLTGN